MNTRTRQAIRLTALLICGAAALVTAARAADGAVLNGESFSFARDLSSEAVIRGFDLPCSSFQIWGDFYVGKGDIDPKGTERSFDNELTGAQIGLNWGLGPGMLATAYYNYQSAELSEGTRFTDQAQTHLGGFGLRYNTGGFYFSLLGTAGLDDYELTGSGVDGVLGCDGWQAGGSLETGYYMRTGGLFTLKPFGNLQYSYMKSDGIDLNSLSLKEEKFKADVLFQTLGARIDAELGFATLQARFGWVHQYLKSAPIQTYWFSRTPGTYTPAQAFFEGSTGTDHFWGGAGVKFSLFGTIAANLDYDVLFNSRQTTHMASAGLLWSF